MKKDNSSKGAIPVGGLYIVTFLVLLALAGMALYLYINGQSTAREYRIAAASLLQTSEEFKRFVDQERLYAIETVLFFLGSQGGIDNIQTYNEINMSLIVDTPATSAYYDIEAKTCYELLKERLGAPSNEVLYRCFNNRKNLFYNQESEGIWKCDAMMYSFKECEGITLLGAKHCCSHAFKNGQEITSYEAVKNANGGAHNAEGVIGLSCHEGCLQAMELSNATAVNYENLCYDLDYCGALWCKADNLEIPESYQGVPYYYKMGESGPGYFCPSSYDFSPEKTYSEGKYWSEANVDDVINKLLNLSNNYFYVPSPKFLNFVSVVFDSNIRITFQLDFKGCNNEMCEFVWVPYGESQQGFLGRGFGGVPMVDFSTELLSIQTVPIPVEDMVNYVEQIITDQRIVNYFANGLENMVYQKNLDVNNAGYTSTEYKSGKEFEEWKDEIGRNVFGINCGGEPRGEVGEQLADTVFDYYDNRSCGPDPYSNNCEYQCLMQHASTKLYQATKNPFFYDREEGLYDYYLRPVFRFVETSLGAKINTRYESSDGDGVCGYGETYQTNPSDCWSGCGNGVIDNCPDITSNCGNGVCEVRLGELGDCSSDCGAGILSAPSNLDFNCGDNICGSGETYSSCPNDCANHNDIMKCKGDAYGSSNVRENCPTDTSAGAGVGFSYQVLPGNYHVFVKGDGNVNATIQVTDSSTGAIYTFPFSYNDDEPFYKPLSVLGPQGRCAWNSTLIWANKSNMEADFIQLQDSLEDLNSASDYICFLGYNPLICGEAQDYYNYGNVISRYFSQHLISTYGLNDLGNVISLAAFVETFREAYNLDNVATVEEYHNGYGCCRVEYYDEDTNTCDDYTIANNYCTQMKNGYGRTEHGDACALFPAIGESGDVDYDNKMMSLSGEGVVSLQWLPGGGVESLSNITSVEILRVDYDNTLETIEYYADNVDWESHYRGGSHEYYLEGEVEDCGDPFENSAERVYYKDFDDVLLWYSLFCIRAQGYSWNYIMEDETGIFDEFTRKVPNWGSEASKMDKFLETVTVSVTTTEQTGKTLKFTPKQGVTLSTVKDRKIIPELQLSYAEESVNFNPMESILDRLYEISLNSNYISLPMKWVFAYRDKVEIDQTMGNVNEDAGCDLNYADIQGARGPPDCSCRECNPSRVCNFDFEDVLITNLANGLYKFKETFILNYDDYTRVGIIK